MSHRYLKGVLSALPLSCLLSSVDPATAHAQTAVSGAIVGSVTDPSGARVPRAQVTAVNSGTNATSEATADDAGPFRLPNLVPGTYRVTVTAPGFERLESSQVVVEVGQPTTLDERLTLGAGTQTVQVQTADPRIDT